LLAAVPAAERAQLVPALDLVELPFGQVLAAPGEPVTQVYFPVSGLVSLVALTAAPDRPLAVEVVGIGREGLVGLSLPTEAPAWLRARCQLPGLAYRLPLERFWETQERLPGVRRVAWQYAQFALLRLSHLAVCNLLHSVTQRSARWLLDAHDHAEGDTFRLTHEVLAEMLGAERSTVTAAVRRLADRGVLDYRWGTLTIVDRAGLEAASCACYQQIRADYAGLFPG
jgi:CRP-like cAMP-binding protein